MEELMLTKEEFIHLAKKYNPNLDELLVGNSFELAKRVHDGQKRVSGENYFTHPIAVSLMLLKKGMDDVTVSVGLLHDVIEDSRFTSDDIAREISDEVAFLVDGVTKISNLQVQSLHEKQAENFRKLVFAMSKDLRVIIVKLADRLHNMRTLHFLKNSNDQKRISQETMDIYVPLAERLGIRDWKVELEDIAFSFLEPVAYAELHKRHHNLLTCGNSIINSHIELIEELLHLNHVSAEIKGRCKTLYSIWQKLKKYGGMYKKVTDLVAFRIIVSDIKACYQVLGILHTIYPVIPGRFKDYISFPKTNGYQSLHTVVMGPYRNRIEIQIRTKQMDDIAELGVASHWIYKQKEDKFHSNKHQKWMHEIVDLLSTTSTKELLDETKMTLLSNKQVFVFSRNGDVFSLMQGSCLIDFAYTIHSDIGNHCYSGMINGRVVPLKTILQTGDQVEIFTSNTSHPSARWLGFVVTVKAKTSIRRYLRLINREQDIAIGCEMLKKESIKYNIQYADLGLDKILYVFNVKSTDDLLANIGNGRISVSHVFEKLLPEGKKKIRNYDSIYQKESQWIVGLVPNVKVDYARCCHPLPGDAIVGVIRVGQGVSIHQNNCPLIEHFDPTRLIDVGWQENENSDQLFTTRVKVVYQDMIGGLTSLSSLISSSEARVKDMRFVERGSDFVNLVLDLDVKDRAHFETILQHLRLSPFVFSAEKV